ncbi:hypothetical protein N665_0818s0036 [Sinapis alba]|nr:hypothetical protein N665_0818s0036 [Sinapis alba]
MVFIIPATLLPQSSEGFYAINNPFQTNGPKWFSETKWLDFAFEDLYLRMDLPGAGPDDVTFSVDDSKKGVTINAKVPWRNINDCFSRSYETYVALGCQCCEISRIVNSQVSDGVLRLLISTTPISIDGVPDEDPEKTGLTLQPHPGLTHGPASAYEYKQLIDGSVYVRLDMPGVPENKVNFNVDDVNRRVNVVGEAPAVSHDSGDRSYSAVAALFNTAVYSSSPPRLETTVKNGVVRLVIHPA